MRLMLTCRRIFSPTTALPFLQNRVRNTVAGFNALLGLPDFGHDGIPAGLLGNVQRHNPSDGAAIAGYEQRLALFKLVQDRLGFLMQLFCSNCAHLLKVTP
jgi:hypothetical protein